MEIDCVGGSDRMLALRKKVPTLLITLPIFPSGPSNTDESASDEPATRALSSKSLCGSCSIGQILIMLSGATYI
tara:strand:- start:2593 stop:2814 length:222 start_codon:yes stop_codon:yes gene_type:complete